MRRNIRSSPCRARSRCLCWRCEHGGSRSLEGRHARLRGRGRSGVSGSGARLGRRDVPRRREQIFEGLVKLKPGTTKVVPALATSWGGSTGRQDLDLQPAQGREVPRRHAVQRRSRLLQLQPLVQLDRPVPGASRDLLLPGCIRRVQEERSRESLAKPLYKSCAARATHRSSITLNAAVGRRSSASLVIQSFAIQSPTALKRYGADQATLDAAARSSRPARTRSSTRPAPARSSSRLGRSARRSSSSKTTATGARRHGWTRSSSGRSRTTRRASRRCRRARSTRTTSHAPQDIGDCPVIRSLKVIKRPAFNVAYVGDQPGARLADEQAQARPPGGRVRPRPRSRGEELLLRRRVRWRTSSCRRASSATRRRSRSTRTTRRRRRRCSAGRPESCRSRSTSGTRRSVSRPYMPDPKRNFEALRSEPRGRPASTWSRTVRRGGRRTCRR